MPEDCIESNHAVNSDTIIFCLIKSFLVVKTFPPLLPVSYDPQSIITSFPS